MVWAPKESKPNVGHPRKVPDKMHQRQLVVKQHPPYDSQLIERFNPPALPWYKQIDKVK